MNEPATVTYPVGEILKRIEDKLDRQSEKIGTIEVKLTAVETELKGVNKRLDSQEFINRSVAIEVIVALVTGVVKLFFPNFPNIPH